MTKNFFTRTLHRLTDGENGEILFFILTLITITVLFGGIIYFIST